MSDLSVGSTFAGCRLEAVAGRGGMGIVYRGTQLTLGRRVALKAMAPDLARDDAFRERFERESQLAASIDHPNVIPVYEAGERDGTLYLMMRWVDGTDLRTVLTDSGRLSPARALQLLRPVAAALSAAHRRGLVHRDIKPANVLVSRSEDSGEEHVYLTDFGIARRVDTETAITKTGMFVGTVDYTAPERIEGSRGDARSDIYSFGCMLFESVTGHVPFDRPSEVSKIFAHVNDPVPSARTEVAEIPEELDSLIQRTMAKRPEDRFGTAAEVTAALDEVLRRLETAERPQPAAPTRRSPIPPVTAAATPDATLAATTDELPRGRDRSSSRPWWQIAVPIALVAVIAGVLAAALSGGGGSEHPATNAAAVGGGSAASPEVTAVAGNGIGVVRTIALGAPAAGMSVGVNGNLWVSLPAGGTLARVAPVTGRRDSLSVGGHPTAISAGPNGIWVAGSAAGALARLAPRSGAPVATAQLPQAATAIAADPGDGSVWAAEAGGQIIHFDAGGAPVGKPATLTPAAKALGVGESWLWAAGAWPGGLARIGLGGSAQPQVMNAGGGASGVAFDAGVWVAHTDGHVSRFDPRTDHLGVNATVPVAPELDAIAAIEQRRAVWTISGQARALYRISNDASPRVTGRVRFASPPVALAFAGRYVWVATQDGELIQLTV